MNFHSALNVVRDIFKAHPDAIMVNEGANALDFTRSIVDMYKPRKRLDVGTWGVMGIGMGFAVAAAVVSGEQVIAIEGDSAFGFSGMEVETICRYNLPVCIVVFNNNGVYRGTDVNPSGSADVAPTVFVKGARYDRLMEAFGGTGVHATTPAELRAAMEEAIRSRRPTLINAVIDEKSFDKIKKYIDDVKGSGNASIIAGGSCDKSTGYFIEPTVIEAKDPKYVTMCEEIFGPVLTIYVYDEHQFEQTLELVNDTSPYALTGAVIATDRAAVELATRKLVNAAGNFYINDKPTGAVVGQQPFGGARGSGTNDKAGSILNLYRWLSARTIKETFNPPVDYRYPFMQES
jgi:hypothetical protein